MHNIVLAHPDCNGERGCPPPTEQDITRAARIYAALGLVAFEVSHPRLAARHTVHIGEFASLADVWPRR
jgi:hypothetical protein